MDKEIKDENILDQETIDQIKKDLLERRAQILEDLKDVSDKTGHAKFPEYGNKSDENAQEISEYTTNLATDQLLDKTLVDIDGTLKRIEDGTYGTCKYCGQPIGRKRLLARPVASACIQCKIKLQNNE